MGREVASAALSRRRPREEKEGKREKEGGVSPDALETVIVISPTEKIISESPQV
jgi:hypothetical protein